MAHARCAGAALGQGSRVYAADRGRPELSMSVKGLELPAYDPRGAYGIALSYAVSTRGGCHLRGGCLSHEILRKPVATDRFSLSGKARIVKIGEDATATMDALSVCKIRVSRGQSGGIRQSLRGRDRRLPRKPTNCCVAARASTTRSGS